MNRKFFVVIKDCTVKIPHPARTSKEEEANNKNRCMAPAFIILTVLTEKPCSLNAHKFTLLKILQDTSHFGVRQFKTFPELVPSSAFRLICKQI
jgi:hypothetical protein